MFTGIVQGLAKIISIKKKINYFKYNIKFPKKLIYHLQVGGSVSINGCCLTVTNIKKYNISFDIILTTFKIINFSYLHVGSKVNIERSLKFGDEIGGHLVSGHVIDTAKIINIFDMKNYKTFLFKLYNVKNMKYLFVKGFIAIDGISVTIYNIYKNIFYVNFIPETICKTNVLTRKIGDVVNIEVDYYTQIIIDRLEKYNKV